MKSTNITPLESIFAAACAFLWPDGVNGDHIYSDEEEPSCMGLFPKKGWEHG